MGRPTEALRSLRRAASHPYGPPIDRTWSLRPNASMPTFSPALDLPAELAAGLLSGRFSLFGGVVRIAKGNAGAGQVVALLKDAATANLPAIASGVLPAIAAVSSVATLGVCALGFSVMYVKLEGIKKELKFISRTVKGIADDLDRVIVANLDAANELLKKAQRADHPSQSEFTTPAVDRYLEAASIYKQRFDNTEDRQRDLLGQYLKALNIAVCGELACHYVRGDWKELTAAATEAVETFRPRAERLLSLSLWGPAYRSSVEKEEAAAGAAALFLDPLLIERLPFSTLLWLHQQLDLSVTAEQLIDDLRMPMQLAFGARDAHFGEKLGIADLDGLSTTGGMLSNLRQRKEFPTVALAVLRPGIQAATMLAAIRSYPIQYEALRDAEVPYSKLLEMFPGQQPDVEAYLVTPEAVAA